jgi:putative oxidoreductase
MSATLPQSVSALGRVLLSVIFLVSGITKLAHWSDTAAMMATHGMPVAPLLLGLATFAEIAGGLALLLGFLTRPVSFLLFLYLIPTTLIFHNFWAYEGQAQQMQLINFLKNLAIMGGLLKFAAEGALALSLDALLKRPAPWRTYLWPRGGRPA